jgi:hypothetical protein
MGKQVVKGMIVCLIILIPVIILRNKPSDFSSSLDYYLGMSSPLVMILGCVLYLGSWSDIEATDSGLLVEFLGKKLFIPWDGIIEVKRVPTYFFGLTIVLTKNEYLTPLHRLYSLFTVGQFIPGFQIHPQHLQFHELYKLMRKSRNQIYVK